MAKGFWDDLGSTLTRKAKGFSTKAENLYEIQKIRNKLSAQERMTEKLMMDIGRMIYARYEHGEAVDGEVGAICEEISQHMLEADHYRDAIAASKGEKFCPACHKAVMREASFCPYCGAACPTPEPQIEGKDAEVIEAGDEELENAAEAEVAGDAENGETVDMVDTEASEDTADKAVEEEPVQEESVQDSQTESEPAGEEVSDAPEETAEKTVAETEEPAAADETTKPENE